MPDKSFEHKMERLSQIADALGKEGAPLADSLELYNEAVKTALEMHGELEAAKGKVVLIRKNADGVFYEEEVVSDEF